MYKQRKEIPLKKAGGGAEMWVRVMFSGGGISKSLGFMWSSTELGDRRSRKGERKVYRRISF
jgi:hypothetical protein